MDNTLNIKLSEFKKALDSLDAVLREEKNDIIRDSAIKRFEYCFELCWKSGKIFLRAKFGVDVYSPKEVFRELRKNQLLSDEEAELLLVMTDNRNEIIHTYNEFFSDELYGKIKDKYFAAIKNVFDKIAK